jgi:hypothetical protein
LPCATWRPSGERSAAHAKATALRAPPLPIAEHGWFITLADVHGGDTTGRIGKHNRGGFLGKDKPLYLDGFTKGEVIRHYSLIAPVLLRHLKGRPSPRSVSRTGWAGGRSSRRTSRAESRTGCAPSHCSARDRAGGGDDRVRVV